MMHVSCHRCKKEFSIKPSRLQKGGKYCSRHCWHIANRKGKEVSCNNCGKQVYKQPKALKNSKSGKFFCGKSCQTIWRNKEFTEDKHANWKTGKYSYRRKMLQSGKAMMCGRCKTTDKRILAVHHLDQNNRNHNIENLAWLCHNGHHLIHHHPDEYKKYMATMV